LYVRLNGQHCFIDIQNAYRVFFGEALLLNSRFQDKLKVCRCPLTYGFCILPHLVARLVNQLTYRQTCWNDVQCPTKTQEFTLHHYVQCRLGQSEDWIFWVSLVMGTCNVWRNKLPAVLSGIGRHFKFCRYVNCKPSAGEMDGLL